MKRNNWIPDPALFVFALLATMAGLFFIFDAGYARSLSDRHGVLPGEFKSQIIFLGIALTGGLACTRVRIASWSKLANWIFFGCMALLLAVPRLGHEMNGAKRWIGVGAISIQPAEFVKLATVLYLAAVFAERKPIDPATKGRGWAYWMDNVFVPKLGRIMPGLWVLLSVVLIEKEPDLGTAAVIAVIGLAMFVLGGASKQSLALIAALALVGGFLMVKQEPYRWTRIVNHTQRWEAKNVDDTSYQTVQSELAMATGGIAGQGIGSGRAKQVIPAPTTDFIMATVGEEFGLLGSLTVIAILGTLTWRLLYLAGRARTRFGSLVLYGMAAWIGIQSCVNVMMANAFLPAIGIPLPFVSSGGSSLLALWCGIGVCQSVFVVPVRRLAAVREAPGAAATAGASSRGAVWFS